MDWDLVLSRLKLLGAAYYVGSGVVASAGACASFRFLESLSVTIENPTHPRRLFPRLQSVFAWCDPNGLDGLVAIEPIHAAAYIRGLSTDFEKATVKQPPCRDFGWCSTGSSSARSRGKERGHCAFMS
jgi:hypothetical protein